MKILCFLWGNLLSFLFLICVISLRSLVKLDSCNQVWTQKFIPKGTVFRITKETFHFICAAVAPLIQRRDTTPVTARTAIGLWRLATGDSYRWTRRRNSLVLTLTLNCFSFGGNYYKQTKMGPSYANLFVGFIEHQFFSQYHGSTTVKLTIASALPPLLERSSLNL